MNLLSINYVNVYDAEFKEIKERKDENDYLFYFAYNSYTEFCLISAYSGKLLFSKHFAGAYGVVKGKELKTIAKYF